MKVTLRNKEIKGQEVMLIGVDTGKDELFLYSEYVVDSKRHEMEDRVKNDTRIIQAMLKGLEALAAANGFSRLGFAVEPSGGLEKRLLKAAAKRGHETVYVSGEATSKAKAIESNDSGKHDRKDARVIFLLASMGRTLVCQELPAPYSELRVLSGYYEDMERMGVLLKTEISATLDKLFPDCELQKKTLYSSLGQWLFTRFSLNPAKIAYLTLQGFITLARKDKLRVKEETLKKVYRNAASSARLGLPEGEARIHERQLSFLFEQWRDTGNRKEELRERMLEIYRKLPEGAALKDVDGTKDGFLTARLISETGPLSQFDSPRRLLRFLGLNLRIRQSGRFKGQAKISKKGRSIGRKVLYQIAYGVLIRQGKLFGERYQEMKEKLANGLKAITALMRKFVMVIFGVCRSGKPFDRERVFLDAASYARR